MTKMKIVFVALMLLNLCSCGPYTPWSRPNSAFEREKVLFKDYKVKRYLRLVKHDVTRLPSGSLQAEFVFANVKNKDLWCDFRVNFRNEKGIVVEEGTWERVLFGRNAQKTISRKSIGPAAADYRILIRIQE